MQDFRTAALKSYLRWRRITCAVAEDILVVNGLTKEYRSLLSRKRFTAVDNLSFSIRKGEVFGLLGPNGAGKSTLIKMLTGYLRPTSGDATVNGVPISDRRRVKPLVGWAPQEDSFYNRLTVNENLVYFGSLYGISHKQLEGQASSLLKLLGLTRKKNARASALSGGMKKRLNMGIALMHEPSIVYLDEPTVGVDPISRNGLWEVIERLREQGVTILYTSHYLEEVDRLCDRIAIIRQGAMVTQDTPKGLKKKYGSTLEEAFVSLLTKGGKKR